MQCRHGLSKCSQTLTNQSLHIKVIPGFTAEAANAKKCLVKVTQIWSLNQRNYNIQILFLDLQLNHKLFLGWKNSTDGCSLSAAQNFQDTAESQVPADSGLVLKSALTKLASPQDGISSSVLNSLPTGNVCKQHTLSRFISKKIRKSLHT